MKSFQQLAQAAYEAHQAEEAKQGRAIRYQWSALSPGQQACWVKVAQAVVAEVAAIQ